jgi:hypothetical protein
MINSSGLRWGEDVAYLADMRNAHKILVKSLKGRTIRKTEAKMAG